MMQPRQRNIPKINKIPENIPEKSTKICPACSSVYQLPSQHFQTDFRNQKCAQNNLDKRNTNFHVQHSQQPANEREGGQLASLQVQEQRVRKERGWKEQDTANWLEGVTL
jgi:hypothetical protein